jgi:hypothetical protein
MYFSERTTITRLANLSTDHIYPLNTYPATIFVHVFILLFILSSNSEYGRRYNKVQWLKTLCAG